MDSLALIALEWPHSGRTGGVGRYNVRLAQELSKFAPLVLILRSDADDIQISGAKVRRLPPVASRSRFSRYYGDALRLRQIVSSLPRSTYIISTGDDWLLSRRPNVRILLGTAWREARSSTGLRSLNHYVLSVTEAVSTIRSQTVYAIGPDSFNFARALRRVPEMFPPTAGAPPRARSSDIAGSGLERNGILYIGTYDGRKRGYLADAVFARLRPHWRPIVVCPEADAGRWSEHVEVHCAISDERVGELLDESRFLLAPGKYEGFGLPVYEALGAGAIPLVTRNPGSEFVLDMPGLLPPLPETEFVVRAVQIINAASNDARQANLIRAGIERSQQLYDLGSPGRLLRAAGGHRE